MNQMQIENSKEADNHREIFPTPVIGQSHVIRIAITQRDTEFLGKTSFRAPVSSKSGAYHIKKETKW